MREAHADTDTDALPERRFEDAEVSELRYRTLIEALPDAVLTVGRRMAVLEVNRRAEELFGMPAEDLVGRPLLSLLSDPLPEDDEGRLTMNATAADGRIIPVELRLVRHQDASGPLLTAIVRDVTDRHELESSLRELADRDPLTGLFNRRRFDEELERTVARCRRHDGVAAVLLLDLDGLKAVNDTLGHRVGDAMIRHAAATLSSRLRAEDVLARLGGDEFGVLLSDTGSETGRKVAGDLIAALHDHPLQAGDRVTPLTASIGLSLINADVGSPEEALGRADLAMYEAKEGGRDRVAVFRAATRRRARERLAWEERLRVALDADELVLHGQPVLDVGTGEVHQYEALVRLREPDGRLTPPRAFMGSAVRSGLVGEIDRWVLRRAIEHLAGAPGDIALEVNLSAASIPDAALPGYVARLLGDAGVEPWRLILEITETVAIADVRGAARFAAGLTRLGCRLAVDDFGAGYGSFSYLRHLPLAFVKIDGDYIRNLRESHTDQVLTSGVVQVARGLGIRTIAEHVRDEETLSLVRELAIDLAQGNHIGRPRPLDHALAGR